MTNPIDIGDTSECNQVRPSAEGRGLVCDNFGNLYRLDNSIASFIKDEDLGDFSDCMKQIGL